MPFIGRIALLLVSTVFAGVAWADWIEQSNEHAMMVLQSQALFEPEAIARAGLTDYDADVIDLRTNYQERRTTSDQLLLAELNKHLAVNLVMTN